MYITKSISPVRHIIIDDFLSTKSARACLDEFIRLEPEYEQSTVSGGNTIIDHCKECNDIINFNRQIIRDNSVVYLNKLFFNKENDSIIMKTLHSVIFEFNMMRLFKSTGGLFPILEHTNTTETILSRYGKCDFYGIHKDVLPSHEEKRIITCVYYVNKPDAKFTGGNITLYADDMSETVSIEPKHNRAVFFESKSIHAVETVDLEGDFSDGRFSVNFWFGFDNIYKFKQQ